MKNFINKKSKRKQNIISLVVLIAGVIISLIIFLPKNSNNQDQAINQTDERLPQVEIKEFGSQESQTVSLEKSAFFSSLSNAKAISENSGRIVKVSFDLGQQVQKGQVLAFFDQGEDVALPNLEAAEKNYALAQENLQRTEELVEENIQIARTAKEIAEINLREARSEDDETAEKIAKRTLEQAEDQKDQAQKSAEIQVNTAQIQFNQTENSLRLAQIAYEKTIIRSPISGTIISKNLKENDFISSGQIIAEVIGQGKLETELMVNSKQIKRISQENSVDIVLGGEIYPGKISEISPIAQASNERYAIKIESISSLEELSNQTGQVIIPLSITDSFFLPLEAINIGQRKNIVFIVKDEKIAEIAVETGELIDNQIEVVSGLEKGDLVITSNIKNLNIDQKIQIN